MFRSLNIDFFSNIKFFFLLTLNFSIEIDHQMFLSFYLDLLYNQIGLSFNLDFSTMKCFICTFPSFFLVLYLYFVGKYKIHEERSAQPPWQTNSGPEMGEEGAFCLFLHLCNCDLTCIHTCISILTRCATR